MRKIVYVDNNATTCVDPQVLEAMLPFLKDKYGNPSSMHTFGGRVSKDIEKARQEVAGLIGAESPREIIFTSCGTESNNTAIISSLKVNPEKRHIITTKVEHPAILTLCKHLEEEGYKVTYLDVDSQGLLNLDQLRESITPETAIVSVMWANNETGVIFPIEEVAKICYERGVIFHTDAVQAAGKIPIKLKELPINFLSLSGHKLHAPKGIGALYVKRGTPFKPSIFRIENLIVSLRTSKPGIRKEEEGQVLRM